VRTQRRYNPRITSACMFPEDPAAIVRKITELKIEHRDLDVAISNMPLGLGCDELQLKRMKKRKLRLKDMIAYLENKLIPDLDA
jgi:hypothetical protein